MENGKYVLDNDVVVLYRYAPLSTSTYMRMYADNNNHLHSFRFEVKLTKLAFFRLFSQFCECAHTMSAHAPPTEMDGGGRTVFGLDIARSPPTGKRVHALCSLYNSASVCRGKGNGNRNDSRRESVCQPAYANEWATCVSCFDFLFLNRNVGRCGNRNKGSVRFSC
jgi:hypothetical protein